MTTHLGIAVIGLNGSGKSTLAHALAKELDLYEMDVEDYYFPDQKSSRAASLDGSVHVSAQTSDTLPFSSPRSKEEVSEAILADISKHDRFVASGVTMNWGEKFVSAVDALVMIKTPIAERLSRIKKREEIRFGARVLPGGDMFEQQRMFSEIASKRSEDTVTENAEIFDCPKITIDGTMTFEKEMETVLGFIHELVLDK